MSAPTVLPARRWFGLRPGPPRPERSRRSRRMRPLTWVAVGVLLAWAVVAAAAPLLAPDDPLAQSGRTTSRRGPRTGSVPTSWAATS